MSESTGIVTRFEVLQVTKLKNQQEQVALSAVQHSADKPENKVFSQFTPSGQIQFHISNPDALEIFEPGDEYEVIFRKIPSVAVA